MLEKGFYHQSLGYWQTVGTVSDALLASYPPDTSEVPLRPSGDHQLVDGAWVHVPPTIEQIRASLPDLTARQFRLGVLKAGIGLSAINGTIERMPRGHEKDAAQIEWEYATTFNRMHPLIATIGAALDLSDAQIDVMWVAAAQL